MADADPAEDYASNPSYERRIVAFYDVLGWKTQISNAGTDARRIGDLRRMVLRSPLILSVRRRNVAPDIRFSAFSDNVVISVPAKQGELLSLLGALGSFQISSVTAGFLIRGGITIGDICHDEKIVFGPALNRAYHLESVVADFPRIVLDKDALETLEPLPPYLVATEGGVSFLDALNSFFIRVLLSKSVRGSIWTELGIPAPPPEFALVELVTPPDVFLRGMRDTLNTQVRSPLSDKEWRKVAWLHDRLAKELGLPPANSYPRVRPEDGA